MTTTFHISSDELNDEFVQKLKNAFGEKQLVITVEEDEDDTFFLLSTKSNRSSFSKIDSSHFLNSSGVIEIISPLFSSLMDPTNLLLFDFVDKRKKVSSSSSSTVITNCFFPKAFFNF